MLKKLKKILKIIGVIFLLIFLVLVVLFYRFSTPKSDTKIIEIFEDENKEVYINHRTFDGFNYRIITVQKEIDTTLPTIVFVHGSIGSSLDFKKYMFDNKLSSKANLISYDRIGYGLEQTGKVQESINLEKDLLEDLIEDLDTSKLILVGYSYGGPIVLASKKMYKKVVLLAPAVYSKVEPMPVALAIYKWKATRWLMPKVWQAASKEKLSHKRDLRKFENNWQLNPSKIISIHGDDDWIVPYENSLFIKENFSPLQFELVTLNGAGHGLVWTHFNEIKNILIQQLN